MLQQSVLGGSSIFPFKDELRRVDVTFLSHFPSSGPAFAKFLASWNVFREAGHGVLFFSGLAAIGDSINPPQPWVHLQCRIDYDAASCMLIKKRERSFSIQTVNPLDIGRLRLWRGLVSFLLSGRKGHVMTCDAAADCDRWCVIKAAWRLENCRSFPLPKASIKSLLSQFRKKFGIEKQLWNFLTDTCRLKCQHNFTHTHTNTCTCLVFAAYNPLYACTTDYQSHILRLK